MHQHRRWSTKAQGSCIGESNHEKTLLYAHTTANAHIDRVVDPIGGSTILLGLAVSGTAPVYEMS
jgi:hypothetical protein